MKRIALAALVFLLAAAGARALERFTPPDLGKSYVPPPQTSPAARPQAREYVDTAVLAVALAAAAYLSLRVRRRGWVFALMLGGLAYFGFYRNGCICPIGAIQNVAQALIDPSYAVPAAALLFFLLPLAAALVAGRAFCSGVCPLGALQDLLLLRPVQLPPWLQAALRLPAYLYLALALVVVAGDAGYLICRYDPFVAFFRMDGSGPMFLLGACVLLVGVFVGRPYCRFLCPYGLMLGWASRASARRVTITPDECIRCRLCETACPYGAILPPNAEPGVPSPPPNRRPLLLALAAAPVLIALAAWGGWRLGPSLAELHPTVALDDRIRLEDAGAVKGLTDASKAFREAERSTEALHDDADRVVDRFRSAGAWGGAFVGLAIAAGLIRLSIVRRREDYEADPAACVNCGRCFASCPREQVRRGIVPEGVV